jgi:hypothetical protein
MKIALLLFLYAAAFVWWFFGRRVGLTGRASVVAMASMLLSVTALLVMA